MLHTQCSEINEELTHVFTHVHDSLTLLLFHLPLTLSLEIYNNAGHLQQYTPWHQLLIWLQEEELGFGANIKMH
jgi:hypothetical protein